MGIDGQGNTKRKLLLALLTSEYPCMKPPPESESNLENHNCFFPHPNHLLHGQRIEDLGASQDSDVANCD